MYLTSLEVLFRPPFVLPRENLVCFCVDVIPLLGGIILHVLHALLPLALSVSLSVMCLCS
jgi:hypothetical protein